MGKTFRGKDKERAKHAASRKKAARKARGK